MTLVEGKLPSKSHSVNRKRTQKAEELRNDIMVPIKLASFRNTKCTKLVVWGWAELTWSVLEKEPLYPPGLMEVQPSGFCLWAIIGRKQLVALAGSC